MYLENCGIEEETLCQLDKKKQPLLKKLSIYGCPLKGKQLFGLNNNLGWENLKFLSIGLLEMNE